MTAQMPADIASMARMAFFIFSLSPGPDIGKLSRHKPEGACRKNIVLRLKLDYALVIPGKNRLGREGSRNGMRPRTGNMML
jgi:hypothetical protein